MVCDVKQYFRGYLQQLRSIVDKIPQELFNTSLSADMFSLEMNAKIAANFILRGYCPLTESETISLINNDTGKQTVLKQIAETLLLLEKLPEVHTLDDDKLISDKAGTSVITLCQTAFIFQYIIPNVMFHMSMVYAIARKQGVRLSKSDFDGLHTYPADFSFCGNEPKTL